MLEMTIFSLFVCCYPLLRVYSDKTDIMEIYRVFKFVKM
jgi:hypothetical protein